MVFDVIAALRVKLLKMPIMIEAAEIFCEISLDFREK